MNTKFKKNEFTRTPNFGVSSQSERGFTLIETLVAISILSLSILAGFTAVQNGLKSSQTAKNQIVAFYLVQEAMEYVKNKRDSNALDFINGGPSTWLTGLSACSSPSVCYIDVPSDVITACSGVNTTCPNLVIKTSNGLYGYNAAGVTTNFKRAISYQVVSADEVTFTIWISWTQGVSTKSFQVTHSLFNRLQ